MYDKLITSATGYLFDGKPVDDIRSVLPKIPYYHKKIVIRQVFGSAQVQDKDDEFFRSGVRSDSGGDES